MAQKIPTNEVTDVVKAWVKPQIHQNADGSVQIVETGNTKNGTYRDQVYGSGWKGKVWGRVGEFTFKTAASAFGEGWLATGGKILTKSVGTAFKYVGEGEDFVSGFKTGLIVNTATPSNSAHLFKHGKGGLVASTLATYGDVIKGTSTEPGLTWNPAKFDMMIFGKMRTIRPWTTEIGAVTIEMNTVGYGVYNTLFPGHGGGDGSEHGTTGATSTQLGKAHSDLHTGASTSMETPSMLNNFNAGSSFEKKMDAWVLNGKDETFIALFNQGFKDKAYEYWEAKHNRTIPQSIQMLTNQKEIELGIGIVQHKLDDFVNWNASTMVANEEYIKGLSNGTIVAYSGDPLLNSVAVLGKTTLAGANWAASAVFGTAGKAASTAWSFLGGVTQGVIDIPNDIADKVYDIFKTEASALTSAGYGRPKSIMQIGNDGKAKEVLVRDLKKSENQIAEETMNNQLAEKNNLVRLISADYRNKINTQSQKPKAGAILSKKEKDNIINYIKNLKSK